jgi:putative endonuclease
VTLPFGMDSETMKQPAVYILASSRNGTCTQASPATFVQRIWLHREHLVDGFSKEFKVTRLVWFELHEEMAMAIVREKQVKGWKRRWKIELIEAGNPYWNDPWADIAKA